MKLNYKRTFYVGLTFVSVNAFWQVHDTIVPLILKESFALDDALIGVIMASASLLTLFILPLFGKLSDRTHTPIGRRMPYILAGTLITTLCLLAIPAAEAAGNLILFIALLLLALLAMAAHRSPAVSLMPDITPKPLRSQANAAINLIGSLGSMLILLTMQLLLPPVAAGQVYRPNYLPLFAALVLMMGLSVLVLFWKIKEPACAEEMRRESEAAGLPAEEDTGPGAAGTGVRMPRPVFKSFVLILASAFFWYMGYDGVVSGFSRYATQELQGSFSMLLMVCTAAALLTYLPVGMVAARIGRKKTILTGTLLLFIALFAICFFHAISPALYLFFVLTGVGWAFITVNTYPMVVELASGSDVGRYTGYYYTVTTAAQIAAPVLSGFLMGYVGYRTLFPYAAFFAAAGFSTMCFVRHGDARPTVTRRS